MLFEIEVSTGEKFQVVDITSEVQTLVYRSGVKHGIVIVFVRHTTTGLLINEAESGLLQDIRDQMREMIPRGRGYAHDRIDSNAHAHLRATLFLNPEVVVPIDGAELQLGTWQRILFIELDGPRRRKIQVMVCSCSEFPGE
jgi:secondary thiamine-phosphate synthase enzyme